MKKFLMLFIQIIIISMAISAENKISWIAIKSELASNCVNDGITVITLEFVKPDGSTKTIGNLIGQCHFGEIDEIFNEYYMIKSIKICVNNKIISLIVPKEYSIFKFKNHVINNFGCLKITKDSAGNFNLEINSDKNYMLDSLEKKFRDGYLLNGRKISVYELQGLVNSTEFYSVW